MIDPHWFEASRFGLFVHWGLYAINAWHEHEQGKLKVPRQEYRRLAERFDPVDFDPEAWLDLMDEAGMKYLVFTAKHLDGFCMWDTQQTDYKITGTPFGRDVVAELAAACHRRGIVFCVYYCIVDYHHPNYPHQNRQFELDPQPGDEPDIEKYAAYVKEQIRELLTHYGDIGMVWWDANTPRHHDDSIHHMIRQLQPHCLINERGFHDWSDPEARRKDGLVHLSEREYGTHGADSLAGSGRYPVRVEKCNSVDALSWGWKSDGDYHSARYLQTDLAKVMARGGNYLLNVGPDATGRIPPEHAARLRRVGQWYRMAREALVGVEPVSDTVVNDKLSVSRRGNDLYLLLTTPPTVDSVRLPPIDFVPRQAVLLNTGRRLETKVDRIAAHMDHPYLRVRGLPVDELADQLLVIKLSFDNLPEQLHRPVAEDQRV